MQILALNVLNDDILSLLMCKFLYICISKDIIFAYLF
jgi:hypothetical protein